MRLVIALGGNALLERGQRPDVDTQVLNVRRAVDAVAPLGHAHELVITHGNGPQVGLLALESARDPALTRPYPLDALGAETQGLIGYWLLQALENAIPGREVASLITQTLVGADDPAFGNPTKFVGPVYAEPDAVRLAGARGWAIRPDGAAWRRVVPSPAPIEVVEIPLVRKLLAGGAIVVCGGGGGAPVVRGPDGRLSGVEAVVDKDLTAAILAGALDADALLLLTDVGAVEDGYGTPDARPISRATPAGLRDRPFPPGSMGPKVDAACRFVELTGRTAAIGALGDVQAILDGRAGTIVTRAGSQRHGRHGPVGRVPDHDARR
ncbi:MAG: carbamate kinase [Acidimicrobiales bacterium]